MSPKMKRYESVDAAFQRHCSFFPASGEVMERFADDLARFDVEKGTIRFPIERPMPATLVQKIVRARVREIDAQSRG